MRTNPRARTSSLLATPWLGSSILAFGLALRLYHYARNPALWHDEAANVINILGKSFAGLLGPLRGWATGPPLFLWLQKCVTLGLGDSTYALRLLSVLASCAGLLLFVWLARRLLAPAGACAALLLAACSDRLLWHAAEARHYSSDFLIATALLLAFSLASRWAVARRAFLFALLAPLVIFSAYPGVFLCGGLCLALAPELWRKRRWWAALGLGATVALAFVAFYFITIRVQRAPEVDAAWVQTFPDWQRPWTVPFWILRSSVGVVDYSSRPIGGLLLLPVVLGGVFFWRTAKRELVLFLVGPLFLALCAGLVKAYPYTGARTMVFAMPAVFLLVGGGVDALLRWRPGRPWIRTSALVLIAIPILATCGFALFRVAVPWPRAATAEASAYVLANRQADEPVTANHWEYEYYFRHLGAAFAPELSRLASPENTSRVWVVVTGHDGTTRAAVIASFPKWRTLKRHEFARTSVLLMVPR